MRALLFVLLAACLGAGALSAQASVVKTIKDDKGWKLQVDGEDLAIKGVVWSYTPKGEDFTYNLWGQPDEYITRVIDTDMTLMKAMGVNTIRVFSTVPAKWIEYIYDQYGIYTMVNDLFGRYGVEVDGKWQFPTDYSDPDTRKVLLAQAKATFETYKDTRGVLLYMLGNESNYGLEWTSAATENLPGGERSAFKAKALYTLFEQAFALGKTIDQNHPMGLVNGDLQYMSVMKELVPDLDILGVNTYRGPKSYDPFYKSIATGLDRPFVYTELGADCYNVATDQEDQLDQAKLIASQWREIYEQSYGKGKSANCLGGYVFEWMDEWWKNGPAAGLDHHATEGTWNNGAYAFDEVAGKNNMNEEWFGITAMSLKTDDGVARRIPRAAYFALKDIWRTNMYTSTNNEISSVFNNLDLTGPQTQGLALALGDGTTDPHPGLEVHGSITTRSYFKGDNLGWAGKVASNDPSQQPGSEPTAYDPMEAFQTTEKIGATLRVNEGLTGNFLFRLLPAKEANNPAFDLSDPSESAAQTEGGPVDVPGTARTTLNQFELYQATISYESKAVNATVHFHDGHTDWVNEGDFFGLLPETFDMLNTDKAGSKAPFGIEMTFPSTLPGLKIYAGPEIYWGANPSVMAKYTQAVGPVTLTLIHDQEVGTYMIPSTNWSAAAGPTGSLGSTVDQRTADPWTSLSGTFEAPGWTKVDAGVLLGRYDRLYSANWTYNEFSDDVLTTNKEFSLTDALGAKVKVATDGLPYVNGSIQYTYAGVLAGTRSAVPRDGSQLYDSGAGNRSEVKASVMGIYGDYSLVLTGLYRVPLVDPLDPTTSGLNPRDPTQDSFIVWDNRKATQAEMVFTWNPTGATYFHDWNNADREEAPVAASLGFLYNFYLGPTDKGSFIDTDNLPGGTLTPASTTYVDTWWGRTYASNLYVFSAGEPAVSDTWSVLARVTGRPFPGVKMNLTGQVARQQATGYDSTDWGTANAVPVIQFWKTGAQVAWNQFLFEGSYASNDWGPYDWDRQFGISYPAQWMVGVAYGLKPISFLTDTDRIGVRFTERTFGSYTQAQESDGLSYRFVAELYAGWSF